VAPQIATNFGIGTLAVVDKSQVFALKLNREEFAKKSIDLIRRKFSIDAGAATSVRPIHNFETISADCWKPAVHHPR
jgi:hypothetical protein